MPKDKKEVSEALEISAAVAGQACMERRDMGVTAEDLDAIGEVFFEAAKAVRAGMSGTVQCNIKGFGLLAHVDIVQPGYEFDWDNGLPIIIDVKHAVAVTPNDPRYQVRNLDIEEALRDLAHDIRKRLMPGYGFTLLITPYERHELYYVSSVQRQQIVSAMREFILKFGVN